MIRRAFMTTVAAATLAAGLAPGLATAQEVTLRLHQFLPPVATVPAKILKPWASEVEAASDGRIKIEHYDSMTLGGKPPELIDQAIDGVADIVMTVVGYTPGRYPKTEVFELPFMMTNPVATSMAFQDLVETDLQDGEYKDVKVLGAWVHGPGVIHADKPILSVEDMKGVKMRGPTRVINDMLKELGAVPVGMPLPAIPEALSKGVVNGTVIPWEVTPAIRLAELSNNHTEFTGDQALYTATIIMVMNKAKYDSMPDDLKAVLDAQSGMKLSEFAAQVMWDADAPAREIAVKNGNTINALSEAEVAKFKEKAGPVTDRWIADMEAKSIDGAALIEQAKDLIKKHGG
ncbi:TRAP-type C4-dicarboxylate transport system, substrate-binding protein [Pseudooceanicola nitratireducens]|jgi:TRAP-type C4-dicarboxylate transport system substrate-binding protein|uniref:TRAP-type C4-dicarboxylate transport system, substrate-binding protein n=1 Tax=Pseudooceanicola nitratireducens TaxID=517719 RepID=A0A1I1K7L3_9RHOB|nr:TRAP-type C4-dicarboxylate transport system, substrate-binding protein [Pseudooceanicola nitratireducens]SFC54043.1 TRAP-type C4-dicarboxylate transport system, substrate-binding protein [Pseudooceanicola nitratireducens]